MRWISLISSGHSIQMQKNTPHSQLHGTFSRIGHILGHKSNLSKFKKIEIVSNIFSNHNIMRLDINYKKKIVRNTIMVFLTDQNLGTGIDEKKAKKRRTQGTQLSSGRSVFYSWQHVFIYCYTRKL